MTNRILINDLDVKRVEKQRKQRDRLTSFLYLLMRDFVLPGDIESILEDLGDSGENVCPNQHLAAYAEDVKERILNVNSD